MFICSTCGVLCQMRTVTYALGAMVGARVMFTKRLSRGVMRHVTCHALDAESEQARCCIQNAICNCCILHVLPKVRLSMIRKIKSFRRNLMSSWLCIYEPLRMKMTLGMSWNSFQATDLNETSYRVALEIDYLIDWNHFQVIPKIWKFRFHSQRLNSVSVELLLNGIPEINKNYSNLFDAMGPCWRIFISSIFWACAFPLKIRATLATGHINGRPNEK